MPLFDNARRSLAISLTADPSKDRAIRRDLFEHDIHVFDDMADVADAVVVDLSHADQRRGHLDSAISAGRRKAGCRPVIFLCQPCQLGLDKIADLAKRDTLVVAAAGHEALAAEIGRRALACDWADEAAVRLKAMSTLGIGMLHAPQTAPPAASLLQGEPGPLMLAVAGELGVRTTLRMTLSRQQTLNALEQGMADCLYILAGQHRRTQAGLVRLIRRHTEMRSLPVVVIERRPTDRHRRYWTRAGVDMVVAPSQLGVAAAVSQTKARVRTTDDGIRHLLAGAGFTDAGEPCRLTSPRFFDACLAQRCRMANVPFALAAIRFDPVEGTPTDASSSEPAVYVSMGVQAADLVTRVSPDVLLISMAGTDRHNAARTMQTLSALVADLKFGSRDAPALFRARTEIVIAMPGDDPEMLTRRVLSGLPARGRARLLA